MLLILAIVSIKILTDHKIITFANESVKDYQKAKNDKTRKLNDVAKITSKLNNKQTADLTGKCYKNGNTVAGIYYVINNIVYDSAGKVIGKFTSQNVLELDDETYTKNN